VGFPGELFDLFNTIRSKGILLSDQENIQTQVDRLRKIESSWIFRILMLPLAFLMTWYANQDIHGYYPIPWFYLGWHYWVFLVETMSTMYAAIYSIGWSLLALITLNRVFQTSKVKVNPYDADNVGGFRFVGTFILKVTRLALIIIPFLIAETLFAVYLGRGIRGQLNLWLEIVIFPVLLGALIYLPLSSCRKAMLIAKDEFLYPLSEKIINYVAATHASNLISKTQLEDISALIDFQAKLRKDLPTWPFDVSMFQQIGLSIAFSLLPIILNIVSSRWIK